MLLSALQGSTQTLELILNLTRSSFISIVSYSFSSPVIKYFYSPFFISFQQIITEHLPCITQNSALRSTFINLIAHKLEFMRNKIQENTPYNIQTWK